MTTPTMPRLACAGCGTTVDAIGPAGPVWRCPRAGDGDVDHVLRPAGDDAAWPWDADTSSTNPFVRYRTRLTAYRAARALGMRDAAFVALVERLDARVAEVDGAGFGVTPLRIESALAANADLPCGNLMVKVEAEHVSGSHKARHLMGIMLMLDVWRETSATAADDDLRLAIASCGNAALAAAVVARAAGYALDVFVPTWAGESVVGRLLALGATINACARETGATGDPCYHGFKRAVADGATPFCCQGPDNGLTIDGGETLAWEVLDALDGHPPDAVFVQVGGGALASSIVRGFARAHHAGRAARLPRLHAVQTRGCAPLVRAHDAVTLAVLGRLGVAASALSTLDHHAARERVRRAALIARDTTNADIDAALGHAATHRSAYMRPWDVEPVSLATGILDDETYDWLAIVAGMLRSGGYPVLADEDTLARANRVARDTTGIDVCMTGTSGLAGLMDAMPLAPSLAGERLAVVFSGHRR